MTVLSDQCFTAEILADKLVIDPYRPEQQQPASYDVLLDHYFRVFSRHSYACIDPFVEQPDITELITISDKEAFMLHPGQFALASTIERVELPDHMCGRLEGKSSLGRLGLVTHSTAGFIDPGFQGHITLEISNNATLPIRLIPGMPIGQLSLIYLDKPALNPYGSNKLSSKYQDQKGPTPSAYWKNGLPS